MYVWETGTDISAQQHMENGFKRDGSNTLHPPRVQITDYISLHRFEGLMHSVLRLDLILATLLSIVRIISMIRSIIKPTKGGTAPEPMIETYPNGNHSFDLHIMPRNSEGLWQPTPLPITEAASPAPRSKRVVVRKSRRITPAKPLKKSVKKSVRKSPKKVARKTIGKKKPIGKVSVTKKTTTRK